MQITLENLSNLERKLNVSIPFSQIEEKINARLHKIAAKAKLPGFRPGKVPFDVIRKNYFDGARAEVLENLVRDTYAEGIRREKLNPAGLPKIDIISSQEKENEPLVYSAIFEVFPSIKLNDFSKIEVAKSVAKVSDVDVDAMLERMRKAHVVWQELENSERKSQAGDQLTIDFTIKPNAEGAKPKSETGVKFVLGDGRMWADFEKHLYDVGVGEEKTYPLEMPTTHMDDKLAGKMADFTVKVHKICKPILPELDDEFAAKLHITEGGIAKLREEVKAQLDLELDELLKGLFKRAILDRVLDNNPVEVPRVSVERELDRRESEWQNRFAKAGNKQVKAPEFPRGDFQDSAKQSVAFGLLLAAIVREHNLKAEQQEIHKKIDDLVSAYYEDKEDMINKLYSDQRYLAQIESLILEEKVVDFLARQVKVIEKEISYKDAIAQK